MVTYNNESLFEQDSTLVEAVLLFDDGTTLNNSNMMSAWELVEAITSSDVLRFGACEANSYEVSLLNDAISYKGREFDLMLYLNGDTTNPFSVGHYKIAKEKVSGDKRLRDIKAYDKLYEIINADVSAWYEEQPFPMKLSALRLSFISHFGLSMGPTPIMVNDIDIDKTVDTAGISGKRVISSICELNGTFPIIDRSGRYSEVRLRNNSVKTYDRNFGASHEDFVTEKITKLQIRANADDIGTVYGTGDNTYIVEDNFLLYGKTPAELQLIAQNLYGVIKDVEYTPFTMKWRGNPCVEVGDRIDIQTKYGDFSSYVLSRTLKGKKALRDEYTADGKQWQEEKVNASNYDLIQLKGKTNELVRDVAHTNSTIKDLEERAESNFEQTAKALSTKVEQKDFNEFADDISSTVTQTAKDFNLQIQQIQDQIDGAIETFYREGEPTLNNYPAWDWSHSLKLDKPLKFPWGWEYKDEWYKEHARAIVFDEMNGVTYRFQKDANGNWGFHVLENTEYSVVMSKVYNLEVTTEGLKSDVEEVRQTLVEDYVRNDTFNSALEQTVNQIKLDASATYATNASVTRLEGSLAVANNSINAEVIRAKDAEEVLSTQIAQSATSIKAEVVSKQGGVNSSFGWALLDNGFNLYSNNTRVLSCNSAGLIVEGQIKATSGYIGSTSGGFTIGDKAIYNGTTSMVSTTEGVYVGVDGINAGGNFKVDKYGILSLSGDASSIELGDAYVGMRLDKNKLLFKDYGDNSYNTYITRNEIQVGNKTNQHTLSIKSNSITANFSLSGNELTIQCSTNKNIYLKGNETYVGAYTNGKVGFFGTTKSSSRKQVNKLATSASTSSAVAKINELLDALYAYNLIYTT